MKLRKKTGGVLILLILAGFCLPQPLSMPVDGATHRDYNPKTFWHYPWGKSVTHKGVDIFAKEGTSIRSATYGIVVFAGNWGSGGKVVVVLGPKWRLHYYAHLHHIEGSAFRWVNRKSVIGSVGRTGNALNTPPHLHYSIITLVPYIWRVDKDRQGWKKMFFLNPIDFLQKN